MSASVSKSIGSTFSSHSTTSCSRGVMPATVGSERFGKMHFLLRLGRMRSNVQNDSGLRGAIRQIFIGNVKDYGTALADVHLDPAYDAGHDVVDRRADDAADEPDDAIHNRENHD